MPCEGLEAGQTSISEDLAVCCDLEVVVDLNGSQMAWNILV